MPHREDKGVEKRGGVEEATVDGGCDRGRDAFRQVEFGGEGVYVCREKSGMKVKMKMKRVSRFSY